MRKGLLLSLLQEQAGDKTRKVVAAAVLAGALEGLTIVVVGASLDDLREGSISLRNFVLFLLALGGYYYFYKYAIANFTGVALGIVHGLQRRVTDAFRGLSLRQFEKLDDGQVYQEIIGNKDIIIESTRYLVVALSGAVLMTVAFLFALYLSPVGFLVIVASLGASGVLLSAMHKDVMGLQRRIMQLEEKLTLSLKDLLYGFTELRINRAKRDELLDGVIHARADESYALKQESEQLYVRGLAFFNSFIFVPVGAIVFILPGFVEIEYDVLVKLIGVTLFSLGPLTSIITALPALSKADLLIRNVLDFEEKLRNMREEQYQVQDLPFEFERIEMRECGFSYETADGSGPFSVHIDEFTLERGELVFVTGGNGSGKTSFMKLFAGLYPPERGRMLVNGRHVAELGVEAYRSLFSLVPMTFHLFERLYGIPEVDVAYAQRLIADMKLTGKATIAEGARFSSTDLSSGQRRRLAVIAALLEKRPILLFDEVAADFDPIFRRFFYEEFLPGLKREGRTILAISHDDRFFHLADRVVTMRDGRIEAIEANAEFAP